jgi:hypothetical protein
MEAWYKGTERYGGAVTPLYHLLSELEKTEVLVVNGKYLVKADLEQERAEDQEIANAKLTMEKVAAKITKLEQPYKDEITEITEGIEKMHERLIEKWDITDKSYACERGVATLRTTKSLKISDKKRLIAVLLNIDKLPEAVRSWNLTYLRNLKDVDMIEDSIAFYEEHQNVVIKGVTVK